MNKVMLTAKTPGTQNADKSELSSDTLLFANALREVNNVSQKSTQERAERINLITQQIKDGTYNVNPKDVADKILLNL
jgi:anti-sigma28 factor (negative regulator of flagellin synthesis)